MKRTVFTFFTLLLAASFSYAQSFNWTFALGGQASDESQDMAMDIAGNVVVVGNFADTIDFDPGSGVAKLGAGPIADAFVAKYNASGAYQWAHSIYSSGTSLAYAVETDGPGNVYVAGIYEDTLRFSNSSTTLVSRDSLDCFLVKFSSTGSLVWAVSYGGSRDDICNDMVLNANGDIFVAGKIEDSVVFNAGTPVYVMQNTGAYVAKFNSSGQNTDFFYADGNGDNGMANLKLDGQGNIYCAGNYSQTIYFDAPNNTDSLKSTSGSNDHFIAKFNATGDLQWVEGYGNAQTDFIQEIALDGSGNLYAIGNYQNSLTFDPSNSNSTITSNGDFDFYILKLDTSGAFDWVNSFGGMQGDVGFRLLLDQYQMVYVTGYFSSNVDFDPSTGSVAVHISNGSTDVFVAAYNGDGDYFWSESYGSSGFDYASCFDIGLSNMLVFSGAFSDIIDFDPQGGNGSLSNNGLFDAFVTSLDAPVCRPPDVPTLTSTSSEVCVGDFAQILVQPQDSLYQASTWEIYEGSCGGQSLGNSPGGIFVFEPITSATYFVRGVGGCPAPGACDSIRIDLVQLDTSVDNSTYWQLTANADSVSYQWIDCVTGARLQGETNKVLMWDNNFPNNFFAVIIDDGSCVDTSGCHVMMFESVQEHELQTVQVYPNPVSDVLNLQFDSPQERLQITIKTMEGRILRSVQIGNESNIQLDLSDLQTGFYLLELQKNNATVVRKLIVD